MGSDGTPSPRDGDRGDWRRGFPRTGGGGGVGAARSPGPSADRHAERTSQGSAKRGLLAKKEQLEQQIDTLKYQRAAMSPEQYKQQLTESLVALAKVQEELEK